jgi:cytochrome b subunit of formate dehydrogenase
MVSLLAHRPLAEAGLSWLSWTCGAGIVIGIITGVIVWRRHLVYREHRARTGQAGETP